MVLAVPGTGFGPDLVLDALGRLARAVGARAERYAALLRLSSLGLRDRVALMHDPSDPDGSVRGREIALLTNPTSGRGKGARHRDVALARLRESGFVVRNLQGRDADEALDLARACVADGVEALVVCGGDGLVHLGVQAVAGTGVPLGLIPSGTGNDVARYLGLPRTDPVAAADRVIASRRRTIDLARSGDRWFVTVLAAGFDAIVNERANAMTWPKGQMRYNLATLAELRTFRPLPYVLQLDSGSGPRRSSTRRCSSPSATARPSAAACGSPRARCSTTVCSTSW